MKHAPREFRRPGGYFLQYGPASESPVKMTLEDIPFWDISALLSAVRFQIRVLPPEGSGRTQATTAYQYRVAGIVDAKQNEESVAFHLDGSVHPNSVYAWIKKVLAETYAQRAETEAQLLAGRSYDMARSPENATPSPIPLEFQSATFVDLDLSAQDLANR
jgi:hypothetical protein